MPTTKEFDSLTPGRKRVYRAIWKLYKQTKAPLGQSEIANESGVLVGNLNPVLAWLSHPDHQWINKPERKHNAIVPLVKLTKREL